MFARNFSLEATRPSASELDALARLLPAGTLVYLTAVSTQSIAELAATAASLRKAGLEPIAHVAARRIADVGSLHELLRALRGEANMKALLLIGGDVEATGPFPDALAVIQKGDLPALGFEEIGIGAYPEGHPRIPPERLAASLDEKIAAARVQGLRLHIVSQFSFSPEQILAWLKRLRACGIAAPVRVGMAGPTSLPALLRYARRCGVSASLRGLISGAGAGLIGHVGPDRIVETLAAAEGLGAIAPHYFSFGGPVETARYACEAAAGRIAAGRAMAQPN
jgi:methylenetetrahydrofolate reductase (NADPH)